MWLEWIDIAGHPEIIAESCFTTIPTPGSSNSSKKVANWKRPWFFLTQFEKEVSTSARICESLLNTSRMLVLILFPDVLSMLATASANGAMPEPRCGVPKKAIPMVSFSIWLKCWSAEFSERLNALLITRPPRLWTTKTTLRDSYDHRL